MVFLGIKHKLSKITEYLGIVIGVFILRLFIFPLGLVKVNKEIENLEEPDGPKPKPSEIIIDAKDVVAEINPLIYGSFIEVLARCVYGGIWDEYNTNVPLIHRGIRKDVADATRALKMRILRWPGGCFSDRYHWKAGIGPDRKEEKNLHWRWFGPKIGPKHDNHFGSLEFMTIIEEIGAEPYINVNFGSGTAEEAAQWVEYLNGSQDSEYGALRAQHGHPEPFHVKYWGIANEIFGLWEKGNTTPEKYGEDYLKFAKAMRAVDPTIQLIAVGADSDYSDWNPAVLKVAAAEIDLLAHHVYIPNIPLMTMENTMENFYRIIAGAFEMERRIQWVADSIKETVGDSKNIPISFDEWNVMWNVRQHDEGYYTLRDGLFAASVFEALHRLADKVGLATQAQLVNVIPMIVTSKTDLYVNPIYYAFKIFSNFAEQFYVKFSVRCDTRTVSKFGNISETELPYLGCSVTTNDAKDKLIIITINRHHAHDLSCTITLKNFEPNSTAQVYELNGPHHSAFNDFDKKDEVKIQEKEFNEISAEFTYLFPAHSVTALILKKK